MPPAPQPRLGNTRKHVVLSSCPTLMTWYRCVSGVSVLDNGVDAAPLHEETAQPSHLSPPFTLAENQRPPFPYCHLSNVQKTLSTGGSRSSLGSDNVELILS